MFIKKVALITGFALAASSLANAKPPKGNYAIDSSHTSVTFTVDHMGYSRLVGGFNDVSGIINIAEKTDSSMNIEIKTASIDTNHAKRDIHLKSPDFFNAKQFPVIRFTSPLHIDESKEIVTLTGELELLGVTKPIELALHKGKEGEDPWGLYRIGYNANVTLKRSDYGMNFMQGGVGDDIAISISVEAIKQ